MKEQQRSFFFNVDWITILIYLALCLIGWINIYAAVYTPEKSSMLDLSTNYGKQFFFILSAIVVGFVILLLDSKIMIVFSPLIYIITMLLLLAVLVMGHKVAGNQAWIAIGSFRLQPAEFAKFGTALLLANYIGTYSPKLKDFKNILIVACIVGFPLILILLQPDTGSALVFLSFMFPLFREGLSGYFLITFLSAIILFIAKFFIPLWALILILMAIGGLFIFFTRKRSRVLLSTALIIVACILYILSIDFIYNHILQAHQRSRIEVMLGLKMDLKGAGYNVNQSKIAIGSGQLLGKGFLQGTQTKYGYVPEQSTDFIFSTIGEEWGFVGSMVLIGLFLFLLVRIVNMAERQRTQTARVYGYAVASILFFHLFINIGMTIGLMPVIGIPLPFISYGGSSLWSFTVLLFIFLKFDASRMSLNS